MQKTSDRCNLTVFSLLETLYTKVNLVCKNRLRVVQSRLDQISSRWDKSFLKAGKHYLNLLFNVP